ncbi:MAG: dihydrolipoyl dehydrogenase [Coriobacteriia bacterium]|nr:dihydrolipoyl dehydrogenase [Coriobacteriia bacterium]
MSQALHIASQLVVLGGGPGGYIAAFEAAKQAKKTGLDLKITIVEQARLGGTCLNVGCIPTKTILKTAHALAAVQRAGDFAVAGLDSSVAKLDLDALRTRKESVIDELVSQIEASAKRLGIEVIEGTGRLLPESSPIQVAVTSSAGEESILSCDALIIATGSLPTVLPALDAPFVWTSDDAIALREIPESIIIVGGGVIGVEFADAYAHFGSKVQIVELAKNLLPWHDKRVGKALARDFKSRGIDLHLGTSVEAVKQDAVGKAMATLSNGEELNADVIMSAVGRVPNTAGFGFEDAGIEFSGRALAVDAHYQTSLQKVYAIGDVIGGMMLAHEAEHEGLLAARAVIAELAGKTVADAHALDANLIPGCIYTVPEIATVGMGADEAKKQGIAAVTGIAKYSANGKALAEGESEGFVQIVAHAETGEVLGAQILGAKAVELIAIVTPFMANKATVIDIADSVFAHPTLSELIKLAAEVCAGKLKE